jgi:hypothetical protein
LIAAQQALHGIPSKFDPVYVFYCHQSHTSRINADTIVALVDAAARQSVKSLMLGALSIRHLQPFFGTALM